MGPVLKTLVGVYLFVWSVIGILLVVGSFMLGGQMSKFISSSSDLVQMFGGSGGPLSGNNGQPSEMNQEVLSCLQKELGQDVIKRFGEGSEPTEKDREAMKKCGFVPPAGDGQDMSGNQTSPMPSGSFQPASKPTASQPAR